MCIFQTSLKSGCITEFKICHSLIDSPVFYFTIDQNITMHLTIGILDLMKYSIVNSNNVTDIFIGHCLCPRELLVRPNPFFICELLSCMSSFMSCL